MGTRAVLLLFLHVWYIEESGPVLHRLCLNSRMLVQLSNSYPTTIWETRVNNCIKRQLDFKLSLAGGQPHVQMYPAWIFACPCCPWGLLASDGAWRLFVFPPSFSAKMWLPDLDTSFTPFFFTKLLKLRDAHTKMFPVQSQSLDWRYDSTTNALLSLYQTNYPARLSAGRSWKYRWYS